MQNRKKIYGGVVVRLSDRMMLCKAPGCPSTDFSIPGKVWADVVSRCTAPNTRTTALISLNGDDSAAALAISEGEGVTGPTQLSYHIMTDKELAFVILADKGLPRRRGHAALDEVSELFYKMFVESVVKLNTKSVDVFVRPYRDLMIRMSDMDDPDDKVQKVKKAVSEVKDLALDNVERVIQRGQRIDDIVQSTEDLQFQAQGFQRSSRDLRQQLWWNSMKGRLLFGGLVIFIIMIVFFVFFSGGSSQQK